MKSDGKLYFGKRRVRLGCLRMRWVGSKRCLALAVLSISLAITPASCALPTVRHRRCSQQCRPSVYVHTGAADGIQHCPSVFESTCIVHRPVPVPSLSLCLYPLPMPIVQPRSLLSVVSERTICGAEARDQYASLAWRA